jgi:hypothetical protein
LFTKSAAEVLSTKIVYVDMVRGDYHYGGMNTGMSRFTDARRRCRTADQPWIARHSVETFELVDVTMRSEKIKRFGKI